MKILIGYDGSRSADAALDDLKSAGLPDEAEAVVLSVAEVWLSSEKAATVKGNVVSSDSRLKKSKTEYAQNDKKSIGEAETFARHACSRLQKIFPAWKIKSEAVCGSPAHEIITKAFDAKTDLIVVGSHGRSALGRFFLGSVSNKVLTESHCSVRVARGQIEVDPLPSRVIVGYDGSPGADAAIAAVAVRNWREMSDVKIVAAIDSLVPPEIGRFVSPVTRTENKTKNTTEWLEKLAARALKILKEAKLAATLEIIAGNPKEILTEEATRRRADSIFLGATACGSGSVGRFLLGSVSAAVAARANCSVEVIRHA